MYVSDRPTLQNLEVGAETRASAWRGGVKLGHQLGKLWRSRASDFVKYAAVELAS